MLSNFDYLWKRLLCVCVCVCVHSTFGRCCHCPCWKEKVEEKKEEVWKLEHAKALETLINKIDIDAIISNANDLTDEEKIKVTEIVKFLLKNEVICERCVESTSANDKIVLVYTTTSMAARKKITSRTLGFGFCVRHAGHCALYLYTLDDCSEKKAVYLLPCGHKFCKVHYDKTRLEMWMSLCSECNMLMCGRHSVEGFDTHLKCNAPGDKHYVCFNGKDEKNPYKKKDKSYTRKTWVCSEHKMNNK